MADLTTLINRLFKYLFNVITLYDSEYVGFSRLLLLLSVLITHLIIRKMWCLPITLILFSFTHKSTSAIEPSLSVNWDFRRLEEADIEGLITAVLYKEGKESRLHLGPQK